MTDATSIHRRTLLKLAAGAATTSILAPAVAALAGSQPMPRALAAQDEFATIIARRFAELVGEDVDGSLPAVIAARERIASQAAELRAMFAPPGASATIFVDRPLDIAPGTTRTANMGVTFGRLSSLALAWATPGLPTTGDAALKAQLVAALVSLNTTLYFTGANRAGNWYTWEIGAARDILTSLTALGAAVPADLVAEYLMAIAYFAPNPNRRGNIPSLHETGANRVDKALIAILRGCFALDAAVVAQGRDALSDVEGGGRYSVFRYATSGDGFYSDGSFIQHGKMPYIGMYGKTALAGVGSVLNLLNQTSWQVTDPLVGNIFESVEKALVPFMWHGRMLDIARGRGVSRQGTRDYDDGARSIDAVIVLAAASSAHRARFHALAKGWIQRCSQDYFGEVGLAAISRAAGIVADPAVVAAEEVAGHVRFPAQERSVHRRRGWLYTVATSSTRIGRYEWGNRENNEGWYQGDGMGYLHLDGAQDHHSDEFWPTLNPYRLPGVINTDAPRANGAADGTGIPGAYRKFSGGVELDGYGVIGNYLQNFDKTLTGKQTWVCLDDRIVVLGADITCTSEYPVYTTIEQRNLGGTNVAFIGASDQGILSPQLGVTRTLTNPRWMHLTNLRCGRPRSMIGYRLLEDAVVEAGFHARSGTWYNINSGGTTGGNEDIQTRRFFISAIALGVRPAGARFAYAVLPNASLQDVVPSSRNAATTILANTAAAQVVQHGDLVAGNFFEPAATAMIEADDTVSVLLRRNGNRYRLAVSDPIRSTGQVRLTLPTIQPGTVISADAGLTLVAVGSGAQVIAELGGSGATTRVIEWQATT